MVNRLRSPHLRQGPQKGEKHSPAFQRFSDDMHAGNDFTLVEIGDYLQQYDEQSKIDELSGLAGRSWNNVATRTKEFEERYQKLSSNEQSAIRVLIQERIRALETLLKPENNKLNYEEGENSRKKLRGLRHVLNTLSPE